MPNNSVECFFDDFIGIGTVLATANAGGQRWSVADTSSSGTPTYAYTSDLTNAGVLRVGLEATSEVQNVCIYNGDHLWCPWSKIRRAEFNVRISTTLGATATTLLSFGVASARNDAPASIAEMCLFQVNADTAAGVTVESDDGTTDTAPVSTGLTLGSTFKKFVIDFTEGLSDVRFYMDDSNGKLVRVAGSTTFAISAAAGGCQVLFQIQKAANTNVGTFDIDYVKVEYER